MKATNNNTDTLFMEIFVELLAIAKTYFQELFKNEKPGLYTLKDVYAYIANCESLETKQGKAERLTEKEKEQATKYYTKSPYYSNIDSFFINSVSYVCKVSNNIVSIEKDNFKCSFDIVKDNNIFCVPKGGDSLIREIRVWAYTEILEINTKVGVHIEKDINTSIPFSDFLEQSLINLKRHATNKVFFFMEKDGYSWEQPNAQTFHLFKNGKEKTFKDEFEAYNFVRDKENKSYFDFNVSDYTDDMIEVTGLDLESITSKVKQDSPKELKVIQDIKLYDKTGKIVFTYDNGSIDTVVEATFNGDSVLQSVLQKINENM